MHAFNRTSEAEKKVFISYNRNRMKKAKPCIAYVMHEDRRLGCPDAEYFELLQGGYSDWKFPLDTLKRGLAASIGRAEAIRYLKKRQMM